MDFADRAFLIIFQIVMLAVSGTHLAKPHEDFQLGGDLKASEDTTPNRDFRWSYFYFLEKKCTNHCQKRGKPFGRMQGGLCRCYCPITAPDWTLCAGTTPSCDNFCRAIKYPLGGGCIYGPGDCYCYCSPIEFYNASLVYSMPNTTTKPFVLTHVKPIVNHIINKLEINKPTESENAFGNTTLVGSSENGENSQENSGNLGLPGFPDSLSMTNPLPTASFPSLQATGGDSVVDSSIHIGDDDKMLVINETSPSTNFVIQESNSSLANVSNTENVVTSFLSSNTSECLDCHQTEDNSDYFDYSIEYDGYDFDTVVNEHNEGDDIIWEEYSEYYDPISRRGILTDTD